MATLHIDVESVTTTNTHLLSTKQAIEQSVNALKTEIEGMVGTTWIAPGATQFQMEFDQWFAACKQLILALDTLRERLNSEIHEWESTAAES